MHSRQNGNQVFPHRGGCTSLVLQAKMYKAFLQMHALLEHYAPLWYPEDLHSRADAILREYSPRAESKRPNEKPLRRQKLVPRPGFLPSKSSRPFASHATL